MRGQELKIVFKDDMAFLTEEVALDFKQVQISDEPFKFQAPAFWTIRVINYIESEKRLFVAVLSYHVGETKFPPNQIELADILMSVEKVTFKSIDTPGLLRTLHSKQPTTVLAPRPEIIYRRETQIQPETKIVSKPIEGAYQKPFSEPPATIIVRKPIEETYHESFSVPIKDVTFLAGGVAFEKRMQQLEKSVDFFIPNQNVIKEYDAIKNYFANVLKTKHIQVEATITTIDGVLTSRNATSKEIEKIDKTLIEEVKFEFVMAAKIKDSSGDKHLFTMDEYLKAYAGENLETQQLFKDDSEFFETLVEKTETKHYKHLRFLSSKHRHDIQKLRIVHKPFSFVFLLSGIDKFHIIWETLDTEEATYIWTVANDASDLEGAFTNTEKTIGLIVRDGRKKYLSQKEDTFNRVFHDYADLQNGFKIWKNEIENVTA